MPLYILGFGFSPKYAIALSNVTILVRGVYVCVGRVGVVFLLLLDPSLCGTTTDRVSRAPKLHR